MSSDCITEIANILDLFFKGLTDCCILTRYTVQLQISDLDVRTTMTIKDLIQEFIKRLQSLHYKLSVIQLRENSSDTSVSTTFLPVCNKFISKAHQEIITMPEPMSLTAVPGEVQFAVTVPSDNLIQQSPLSKNDGFKISNISTDAERNYKINKPKSTVDINKISRSLRSKEIKNPNRIAVSPHLEWKKNEQNFLIKSNCLSNNNVKFNDPKTKGIIKKNRCGIIGENNLLSEQLILQDLSKSNMLTAATASSSENIVHIIVETMDRPSNSVVNENQLRTKKSGEESNYLCVKCNKIIKGKMEIENHLQLHKPQCYICQKEFITVKELEEHGQLPHKGTGNFTCSVCSKIFTIFQDLKKHNSLYHKNQYDNKNQNKCTSCNKIFVTKLGLTRHTDSHGGKKTAVCDICGKSFRRSDYLQTHCKIHLGKKKFACKICPKRFILKTHLKHHEKIHCDIKDFVCDICNKGFSRKDKLKEHILRHLNIKKFQCSVCNKQYAENRDLRKHLKMHLKTK